MSKKRPRGPHFNVIYKVTHRETGRAYIGRTTSIFNRGQDHKYARDLTKNSILSEDVRREGISAFIIQIIEFCDDADPGEREAFWIEKFGTLHPNGYNLSGGGYGVGQGTRSDELNRRTREGIRRRVIDPEWQKRNAAHLRALWQDPEFRQKQLDSLVFHADPEFRRKVSEARKRNWRDPEYRDRMLPALAESKGEEWSRKQSAAKKRLWQDPEYRQRMREAFKKRAPATADTRAKIGEASRELWQDPEYRKRASAARKNAWKDPAMKEAAKKRTADRWKDPDYRARMAAMSKAKWADPEFRARMMEARRKARDKKK